MAVHIGYKIKQYCFKNHIKNSELSKMMQMNITSVYKLYKRPNINTKLLTKISDVLNYDFYKYFLNKSSENVHKENVRLNEENLVLRKECEALRLENEILNKILLKTH